MLYQYREHRPRTAVPTAARRYGNSRVIGTRERRQGRGANKRGKKKASFQVDGYSLRELEKMRNKHWRTASGPFRSIVPRFKEATNDALGPGGTPIPKLDSGRKINISRGAERKLILSPYSVQPWVHVDSPVQPHVIGYDVHRAVKAVLPRPASPVPFDFGDLRWDADSRRLAKLQREDHARHKRKSDFFRHDPRRKPTCPANTTSPTHYSRQPSYKFKFKDPAKYPRFACRMPEHLDNISRKGKAAPRSTRKKTKGYPGRRPAGWKTSAPKRFDRSHSFFKSYIGKQVSVPPPLTRGRSAPRSIAARPRTGYSGWR